MAVGSDKKHVARGPAIGLRFLALMLLSIVMMVIDHDHDHLDPLRSGLEVVVYPVRVAVDAPPSLWRWSQRSLTGRQDLELENSRLHAERLLTNARLQRYAALEAENARLRTMLEAAPRITDRVRVAELMSVSRNPFRHSIVIDKGTRDGVYEGQSMIDANGIVGQVTEVGILTSQCVLISDPDHALPIEVNRNGLRTIAEGTGEYDRLDLPFLPNNADIEVGDLLVTSGLGGAFPAGYPVAVVTRVLRVPSERFASVSAKPAASLNQMREVMLVWSSESTEPEPDDAPEVEAEAGGDSENEDMTETDAEAGENPDADAGEDTDDGR